MLQCILAAERPYYMNQTVRLRGWFNYVHSLGKTHKPLNRCFHTTVNQSHRSFSQSTTPNLKGNRVKKAGKMEGYLLFGGALLISVGFYVYKNQPFFVKFSKPKNNTVAIIGGGPSGLVAAKEARECGLIPTVFEQENTIGGVWNLVNGKTWESMRINNFRNASSFSDYEWKKGSEDFPYAKDVYQYLCSYAHAFHINDDVRLNSRVTRIKRKDHKWCVKWVNSQGQKESSLFDSVIISSGLYSKPFTPQISGSETFTGSMIHSQNYRKPDPFEGKYVAVIGNAHSGCEIAADIARKAKKVFHIYRQPKWILSRYLKDQASGRLLPSDLSVRRASIYAQFNNVPTAVSNRMSNNFFCALSKEITENYQDLAIPLPSSNPPFVSISDSYFPHIKKGNIILKKGEIQKIDRNNLYLSDGSTITVDDIVFCTGYRTDLSFFSDHQKKDLGLRRDEPIQPFFLYKTVFHPKFPNMAFVGMARFGIFFGLIELQARFACMVISGKIPCPEKELMAKEICTEEEAYDRNPRPQYVRGYVRFSDDLAKQIGALPNFAELEKENPLLYEKLWKGPYTTASFRLTGFGSNRELAIKIIDDLNRTAGAPFSDPKCFYSSDT